MLKFLFSCALIRGFKISRVTNMGVYYDDACNLKVTNMTFVDNSLGLVAFVGKPNILLNQFEDKTVHFDNSLLVGHSPWMDCRVDRVEWTSRDMLQTGKFVTHCQHTACQYTVHREFMLAN